MDDLLEELVAAVWAEWHQFSRFAERREMVDVLAQDDPLAVSASYRADDLDELVVFRREIRDGWSLEDAVYCFVWDVIEPLGYKRSGGRLEPDGPLSKKVANGVLWVGDVGGAPKVQGGRFVRDG